MATNGNQDTYKDEAILRLTNQLSSLQQNENHSLPSLADKRNQAKESFGMLMRAAFGKQTDENKKFQPCKDDLEFLKRVDPALCYMLRQGSLVDFCRILHPVDSVLSQKIGEEEDRLDDQTIVSSLEKNDSIFHLHKGVKDDIEEFKDLTLRANELARKISGLKCSGPELVKVHLLDGHGRMLVCIIKALMDLGLDPDSVLRIKVFEIDEDIHNYHQYVFPTKVEKVKESIIANFDLDRNSVIYLNFCSVASGYDDEAWKSHLQGQSSKKWVPHCCKENVLKYIWKVMRPPYCCTTMVSLVIKQSESTAKIGKEKNRYRKFKSTLGNYITGLGFLYLLRNINLFNAEIVSVRPESQVDWKDKDKREPKSLSSGKWSHPFVTMMVAPTENTDDQACRKLEKQFEDWKIADLREDKMQKGARVKIVNGEHKGESGEILNRTVATLNIKTDQGKPIPRVRLNLCETVD